MKIRIAALIFLTPISYLMASSTNFPRHFLRFSLNRQTVLIFYTQSYELVFVETKNHHCWILLGVRDVVYIYFEKKKQHHIIKDIPK